jgi:hypothetical protein
VAERIVSGVHTTFKDITFIPTGYYADAGGKCPSSTGDLKRLMAK